MSSPFLDSGPAPEVIYYVAASLDGFIATKNGDLGWLTPYEGDAEVAPEFPAFERSIDGIIMGRKTYEFLLKFSQWPHLGKPCWVVTRQTFPEWAPEIQFTADTPRQIVRRAHAQGLKRLWLAGGGQLAAAFRQENLITQIILTTVPILLGEGIPLFAPGPGRMNFRTMHSKAFKCGLVQTLYVADV